MIRTQKGFTTIEILLVLLILAVIGGAGAIVYSNNQSKDNETKTNATSQRKKSDTEHSHTPKTQDDRSLIMQALECSTTDKERVCEIKEQTDTLAWATAGDDYGGSNYYLAKEAGKWNVVHSGNGDVPEDIIAKYNIPDAWLGPRLSEGQ